MNMYIYIRICILYHITSNYHTVWSVDLMLSRVQSLNWQCLNLSLMFLQCFVSKSSCDWCFSGWSKFLCFFLGSKYRGYKKHPNHRAPNQQRDAHVESLHQPFPSPPRATSRSFPTSNRDVCLLVCFFQFQADHVGLEKKGTWKKVTDLFFLHFIKKLTKQIDRTKLRSPGLFHRFLHCSNTTSQAQKGETPRVRVKDVLKRDVEMHLYCKTWWISFVFKNIMNLIPENTVYQ